MNPAQLLLNQMMNSPQVQNNPMAKNAMQMYQSGDTGTPGVHLSAHPAYHQIDLLSSFRFQHCCVLTDTEWL